jgi:hypothetical protein
MELDLQSLFGLLRTAVLIAETVQTIVDPDPDPGGPKTYESYGSGSTILLKMAKAESKTKVALHQPISTDKR